MDIVKTSDLVTADLPNIESPFFAVDKARDLLAGEFASSTLKLQRALSLLPSSIPRREDHSRLLSQVERKIRECELWVVCGIGDGKPFSPVVTWEEDGEGQGVWRINADQAEFALRHTVESLNSNGITPQLLSRHEPGGVGFLSASSLGMELLYRRKEAEFQRPSSSNSQSPFPARPVEPLATATEDSQEQIPTEQTEIHLEIGLFTDGTLNNADNSEIYRSRIKDECLLPLKRGEISKAECEYRLGLALGTSYTNAPSNVAKLAELYAESRDVEDHAITYRLAEYADGIGTQSGADDSLVGMTTGLGDTGITSQVDGAFRNVAQRIDRLGLSGTITTLTFDLFGFSRGAAAARHAAHEINRGPEGSLGQALKTEGIPWPEKVVIRFAGLFDCVAAIVNLANRDLFPNNNRNEPVKLYLDPAMVEQAVHLVASDERRKNFASNSLRNADASLPDNFKEITLPGVHSDIGGGYLDSSREDVLLSPLEQVDLTLLEQPEDTSKWRELDALKQHTEAEGWIGPYSLPVRRSETLKPSPSELGPEGDASLYIYEHFTPQRTPHISRTADLALRMVRQVRGEYSRVTLKLMHGLAQDAGVPFKDLPETSDTEIPAELNGISSSLQDAVSGGESSPSLSKEELELLRQRYIHYSVDYSPFQFMAFGDPTELEFPEMLVPNAATDSGERTTYPNV